MLKATIFDVELFKETTSSRYLGSIIILHHIIPSEPISVYTTLRNLHVLIAILIMYVNLVCSGKLTSFSAAKYYLIIFSLFSPNLLTNK